jgi:5-hydroxyisourate hydrolase-like protein (transthyretin family)
MSKLRVVLLTVVLFLVAASCTPERPPSEPPEEEMLSRTEFTDRIENFFEYAPLKTGRPSAFLIHLTDLSDGSPVEKAAVTLRALERGSDATVTQIQAQIGRVTGIYVAEITLPRPGDYTLEFHIKNAKLDERLSLSDFKVE